MALVSSSHSYPMTPVRGRWVRNTLYQSKLANNNVDRLFDDFQESVQYPRIDTTQATWAARKAQYSWRRSSRPIIEPANDKCLLSLLPDEIVLQIIRYVAPREQSFHVFRYENEGRHTTMIHRLSPPYGNEELDPVAGNVQLNITALASVNRRLSETFYSVMYGDNRFLFELGTSTHWPRPIAKSQSGLHNVESWARVYEARHDTLWPLSPRTSAYVKNVTILVTKTYQELDKYERIHLMRQLNDVERMLNSSTNLCHLTVDMSTNRGPHESPSQRLGWKLHGEDEHVLKLREIINCSSCCKDCSGFDELWELIKEIRCKQNVTLSGHISTELACEMRQAMIIE